MVASIPNQLLRLTVHGRFYRVVKVHGEPYWSVQPYDLKTQLIPTVSIRHEGTVFQVFVHRWMSESFVVPPELLRTCATLNEAYEAATAVILTAEKFEEMLSDGESPEILSPPSPV